MLSAVRNAIITFLVSLLIFGALAWVIIKFAAKSLTGTDPADSGKFETVIPDTGNGSENPTTPVTPENPIKGTSFNILLVGSDYQPDILKDYDVSDQNKNNDGFPIEGRKISADTIILARIDKEKKTVMFSSIPSETRVTVNGVSTKLGYVYGDKGIEFFKEKVEMLTSLPVDYYAAVTISGLENILGKLGKITFDVPKNMNYIDESQNLEINLTKGKQALSANQALQLLRYNLYSDDGETRREISLSFLDAMIKTFATEGNYAKAADYLSQFSKYLETDFGESDLAEQIDLIFAYNEFELKTITYPGYSVTDDDTGETYFKADVTSAHNTFKQYKYTGE